MSFVVFRMRLHQAHVGALGSAEAVASAGIRTRRSTSNEVVAGPRYQFMQMNLPGDVEGLQGAELFQDTQWETPSISREQHGGSPAQDNGLMF